MLRVFRERCHPRVVFIDKRCLVRPDIVADSRHLPVREGSADAVIADPPHIDGMSKKEAQRHVSNRLAHPRRLGHRPIDNMVYLYDYFPHKTAWISYLYHTARECRAALRHGGILWYKIATVRGALIDKAAMVERYHREVGFAVLSHLTQRSGSNQSSCTTHYLLMQLNGSADSVNLQKPT
jgi:hypothetical protein